MTAGRLAAYGSCLAASLWTPVCGADDAGSAPFVDATEIVSGLSIDMRYAGDHNFIGRPVAGYEAPHCWLTREAATALSRVQSDLAASGFGLKVFDCYRPMRAVRQFVAWAKSNDESGKQEFYPRVAKADLIKLGYIADRSSHCRGSTVDLTMIEASTGREFDMGTPFDFFDRRSHPDAKDVSPAAARNRTILRDAMQRRGFVPYDKEWWHFTLKNEPFPERAFDIPIR